MIDETENGVEFVDLPDEDAIDVPLPASFSDAVVHGTDWTTETIISQLKRGNIMLNPRFQRRDAWSKARKSRFIESLILGLPIPQIVLAESKERRGKFVVLDGKQRLLALLQFWGLGDGPNNGYGLSGLEVRKDLQRKKLTSLQTDPALEDDLNALLNQPIRTVVIKNWPDADFLHLVFLRLNTGSVKLSPQELRQAMFPGPFTEFIDEQSTASKPLQDLLKLKEPDYRMRDIEVLVRSIAFGFFLNDYTGRMKKLLDHTFETLNLDWDTLETDVLQACAEFDEATSALMTIFGEEVGRKPGARPFNRAVFDFQVFYARNKTVRDAMVASPDKVRAAFTAIMDDPEFAQAVERDTAGIPNTAKRFIGWGNALNDALAGTPVPTPKLVVNNGEQRIHFAGF